MQRLLTKIKGKVSFINWYDAKLKTSPYKTSMITAGTLGGIGDILSQKCLEGHDIDYKRLAKLSFIGFTFYGPHGLWFYWYLNPWYLSKLLPLFTKTILKWHRVAMSIVFDTVAYNVPYILFSFFYLGLFNHRGNPKKAVGDTMEQFWPAYKAAFAIYPAKQFILYALVPRYIRGIASILARLIWLTVYSFIGYAYKK